MGDPPTGPGIGERVRETARRVDRVHRRHRLVAIPVAVFKKHGDDRGGQWAALIAYYGFFSIFPLLLALATISASVLQDHEELRQRVLDSALRQFPVIGDQIGRNLNALEGSAVALTIGVLGALWAGMGVILSLQNAMDDVWDVPRRSQPGFLKGRLRALLALLGLGLATLLATVLASAGTTQGSFGWVLRAFSLIGTLALYLGIFGTTYRYLTVADVSWRQVLPGAAVASVAWTALLALGSWLVDRQLRGAQEVYGFFAIVLGLLSWITLGATLLMLAAELNVVLARHLYPRSLQPPPLTEPDRRVLAAQVREEAARPTQDVEVRFEPPDAPPGTDED